LSGEVWKGVFTAKPKVYREFLLVNADLTTVLVVI
jgi:hypothetical protein